MKRFPIYDFLPAGRDSAVRLADIQSSFGLDNRAARAEIARERAEGALILSTTAPPGGYFKPASVDELRSFAASMEHRAASTSRAAQAARQRLEVLEQAAGR